MYQCHASQSASIDAEYIQAQIKAFLTYDMREPAMMGGLSSTLNSWEREGAREKERGNDCALGRRSGKPDRRRAEEMVGPPLRGIESECWRVCEGSSRASGARASWVRAPGCDYGRRVRGSGSPKHIQETVFPLHFNFAAGSDNFVLACFSICVDLVIVVRLNRLRH